MGSYRQIFTATATIGLAQAVGLLVGIARTKALALMLGPGGVGLAGLYQSATNVIGTLTGLGIGGSAVREVAAAARVDEGRVARLVTALRRVSIALGLAGVLVTVALAGPLSELSFGTPTHAAAIALSSLTLLFGSVSAGQAALLQGLRRIKELASAQVLGALLGAAGSLAIVYALGERGIAAYLVAVAALAALANWWFARQVRVQPVRLSFGETPAEARSLLVMGSAFMVSAVLGAGVAYLARVIVGRSLGLEAAGLYQATWTISSLYVGFALQAMGADFFPRLTAAVERDGEVNRLVNEQTQVGLLMTTPGIVGMIAFAPWILAAFYSGAFAPAAPVIRWQLLGVALRMVSWPLGYIVLAKGRSGVFVLTETCFATVHVGLLVWFVGLWGLAGAGVAFAAFNAVVTAGIFVVGRSISGFTWSGRSLAVLAVSAASTGLALVSTTYLPTRASVLAGAGLCLGSSVVSAFWLQRLLGLSGAELRRRVAGWVGRDA